MTGVLLKCVGGMYTARAEDGGQYALRARGKLRNIGCTPLVGDRIRFEPGEGEADGWLMEVLARDNELVRPPVANIGRVVLVFAVARPEPDLLLLDRLLIRASQSEVRPIVVFNKCDSDERLALELCEAYARAGLPAYRTSARQRTGIEELRGALRGKVCALAGPSGVGKSTLLNAMFGLTLASGSISVRSERGRHTTRHVELYPLEDGTMVFDTPGFSLLNDALCDPITLQQHYIEMRPYLGQCRFAPCAHIREPDCAVREAVAAGHIDAGRHARYAQIYSEMQTQWRDRYD